MIFIVAIDGPVGSGKSSVAKDVATQLGFAYVDTGAIYRALALAALDENIPWDDEVSLANLASRMEIDFVPDKEGQQTWLNNQNVSKLIRTEEISQGSSKVSQYAQVRKNLLLLQRDLGEKAKHGAVLEGRDIGTVVFPKAQIKFFLIASDEERARRRFEELEGRSVAVSFATVLADLRERDLRDKEREVAPLKAASDAILVNTDGITKTEVVDLIKQKIEQVLSS
ncbi:MAG: (d)CMP kinase [bacterium]|nr:(d)CMP kinase [bacterium]